MTDPAEPERTLRLLWRDRERQAPQRRGRKPKATVDDIVSSAIAIADEQGLDAVTMRSVAERVGVGAMTLYGHVPGRRELLGLMIDGVAAASPRPGHAGDLRDRLTAIADELMAAYRAHPWLVDARQPRPWIGPGMSDRYEWQLAAIDGFGLDDLTMDQVVTLLDAYVRGAAIAWVAEQERERLAETDLEWWTVTGGVLTEVMGDDERFVVSGRVGTAAGEAYGLGDAMRSYRFGLERIVEGVLGLVG